jgi:replicative DNA helicase
VIQLQFLNKVLDTKDASLIVINNLTEEYFSDYIGEFRFIRTHLDTYGNVPDKESFLSKFPDFDIVTVTESDSYLIEELYQDRNKRFLAKTFNSIRKLLNDGRTEEAMRVYTNASQDMTKGVHLDSVDLIQDTSRYDDYVEKCQDFSKFYIKTGFRELDELIGGWDRNEELATIVARPGIGKSWVLLLVAKAALEQGLRVGIYSGEMSENKVGYRFDTLVSHISNSGIMRGNSSIQNDYKVYIDSLREKFSGCLKVITPAMINGPAGVTALRAFVEKENLDILCVDQHSLLEDDRKARNPVDKAANISRDLKNLQVLKKIPIIAVSQQNRGATDEGPSTSNVAQSDRISQDSTVIVFLEQKDGILTLNLVKARDSVNGKKIHYAYDFDKGIFTYMPEEGDPLTNDHCDDLRKEFEYESASGDDVF